MVKYDSQKIEYQLHIDSGYYNTLDIEGFSRMMKDPSYCYKYYCGNRLLGYLKRKYGLIRSTRVGLF